MDALNEIFLETLHEPER